MPSPNSRVVRTLCQTAVALTCIGLIIYLYVRPEPTTGWLYTLLVLVLIGALDELAIL